MIYKPVTDSTVGMDENWLSDITKTYRRSTVRLGYGSGSCDRSQPDIWKNRGDQHVLSITGSCYIMFIFDFPTERLAVFTPVSANTGDLTQNDWPLGSHPSIVLKHILEV